MPPEPKHHDVACNGLRLHGTEQGDGPLVVLFHGWPGLGLSWRHRLPALAAAGSERDVAETRRGILATPGRAAAPRPPDEVLVRPEAGGFRDMMKPAETLPAWLADDELAVMVAEYRRTGFRGGLNYYRNI